MEALLERTYAGAVAETDEMIVKYRALISTDENFASLSESLRGTAILKALMEMVQEDPRWNFRVIAIAAILINREANR